MQLDMPAVGVLVGNIYIIFFYYLKLRIPAIVTADSDLS